MTRKGQVLARLRAAGGLWVDGTELATAEVGGSEGLKRLRELRDDDHLPIEARRHPDPHRAIWQYRLPAEYSLAAPARYSPAAPRPGPPVVPLGPRREWMPTCPVHDKRLTKRRSGGEVCGEFLYSVTPTFAANIYTGRCLRHGTQTVRRPKEFAETS